MQKITDNFTRAVSTGVLTNGVFSLFGVSLNFACFAESAMNIGVSSNKKCCVNNWSKVVFKTGPIMFRNKIGPVFNTTVWAFLF